MDCRNAFGRVVYALVAPCRLCGPRRQSHHEPLLGAASPQPTSPSRSAGGSGAPSLGEAADDGSVGEHGSPRSDRGRAFPDAWTSGGSPAAPPPGSPPRAPAPVDVLETPPPGVHARLAAFERLSAGRGGKPALPPVVHVEVPAPTAGDAARAQAADAQAQAVGPAATAAAVAAVDAAEAAASAVRRPPSGPAASGTTTAPAAAGSPTVPAAEDGAAPATDGDAGCEALPPGEPLASPEAWGGGETTSSASDEGGGSDTTGSPRSEYGSERTRAATERTASGGSGTGAATAAAGGPRAAPGDGAAPPGSAARTLEVMTSLHAHPLSTHASVLSDAAPPPSSHSRRSGSSSSTDEQPDCGGKVVRQAWRALWPRSARARALAAPDLMNSGLRRGALGPQRQGSADTATSGSRSGPPSLA